MDQQLEEQLDSQDPRERAKGIKTLALSGNQENLDLLKDIHEFDPDPQIREYARKAALHLFQSLKDPEEESPQPVKKESFKPQAGELTSVTLDTTPKKVEKQVISKPQREEADKLVQRAFTLYSTDKPKKAIKVFIKALEINPGLEGQTFAGNLAMELTGLPLETAFASLRGPQGKRDLLESLKEKEQSEEEKARKPVRPLTVILLLLAFTALSVAVWYFFDPGILDSIQDWIPR